MKTLKVTESYIILDGTVKEFKKMNASCPGVYILYSGETPQRVNTLKKIYVGKSKNILKRIKGHTVSANNILFIGFLDNYGQGVIDALEDILIKSFRKKLVDEKCKITLENSEQVENEVDIQLSKADFISFKSISRATFETLGISYTDDLKQYVEDKYSNEEGTLLSDKLKLGAVNVLSTFVHKEIPLESGQSPLTVHSFKKNIERACKDERHVFVFVDDKFATEFNKSILKLGEDSIVPDVPFDKVRYVHVSDTYAVVYSNYLSNIGHLPLSKVKSGTFSESDILDDCFRHWDKVSKLPYPSTELESIFGC